MRRILCATLIVSAVVSFASSVDASVGTKCPKAGQINQVRGTKCVRRNGRLVWIQFYSAPGAIGSVAFDPSNSSLAWTAPISWGNPVANYFAVEVRSSAQPIWRRAADLPINSYTATVSNLVAGVSYEFRVAAGNSYGIGGFATTPVATIGSVASPSGSSAVSPTQTTIATQNTIAQTTTTTTTVVGPRTNFGNGTFRVGADVSPGLYQSYTTGSCYWERMSGFSGSLSDIIANDNVSGRAIVEIKPSDVGFKSSRCGAWSPYSTNPTSSFGNGYWKVGGDVQPGTYRTTTASSCYWARLSGFGGELDDILDNDNADGTDVVVQILPGDYGFESSRCGTWTRIG